MLEFDDIPEMTKKVPAQAAQAKKLRAPREIKKEDEPVQTTGEVISSTEKGRELILGDRQTGKTALAVDAIINQKDTGANRFVMDHNRCLEKADLWPWSCGFRFGLKANSLREYPSWPWRPERFLGNYEHDVLGLLSGRKAPVR